MNMNRKVQRVSGAGCGWSQSRVRQFAVSHSSFQVMLAFDAMNEQTDWPDDLLTFQVIHNLGYWKSGGLWWKWVNMDIETALSGNEDHYCQKIAMFQAH